MPAQGLNNLLKYQQTIINEALCSHVREHACLVQKILLKNQCKWNKFILVQCVVHIWSAVDVLGVNVDWKLGKYFYIRGMTLFFDSSLCWNDVSKQDLGCTPTCMSRRKIDLSRCGYAHAGGVINNVNDDSVTTNCACVCVWARRPHARPDAGPKWEH